MISAWRLIMRYSMDLRQRAVRAMEQGQALAQVARRFQVSETALRDWRRRAAEGRLEPTDKPGPKGPRKLTPADDATMRRLIDEQPGITAKQILPQLSVEVHIATVCRRLIQLGLSLKKSR